MEESAVCEVVRKGKLLSNVTTVDLGLNKLSWRVARELKEADFFKLRVLNLTAWSKERSLGEKGAEWLAGATWPHLQVLIMIGNKVGDRGATLLAKADWPELASLDLSFNKITDLGLAHVLDSAWPQLKTCVLSAFLTRRQPLRRHLLPQSPQRPLAPAAGAQPGWQPPRRQSPRTWQARLAPPADCQPQSLLPQG
jgi:hypothetical protein